MTVKEMKEEVKLKREQAMQLDVRSEEFTKLIEEAYRLDNKIRLYYTTKKLK